ncbi:MAG TPA: hypothetical protein PLW43_12495 [Chitinophagales bacterium]|nr:hypothetical protein [Chitinophagales bacterium]
MEIAITTCICWDLTAIALGCQNWTLFNIAWSILTYLKEKLDQL